MEFLIVNGHIISKDKASLNRFLWNDPILVSQKVWFGHGGIPLLQENLENLQQQLKTFGANLPPLFSNFRELFRLCKRLLNKNKFYRSGHLLFQFSISDKKVNYLISVKNYSGFNFPLNEQGLLVNTATSKKYSQQLFNDLNCHNQLFWAAARNQLRETPFQNSILLNEENFVCEAIASNLFFLKDGVLITPAPETGCYRDVIRKIVLEEAARSKIKTLESADIAPEILFEMDEIFLASEARGIEWVLGIENKRFVRSGSLDIYHRINDSLKSSVTNFYES